MTELRNVAIHRCRGALVLALALLSAVPAVADDLAQARDHFKKGQARYAQGDFTGAAQEFREAYRLRDEPALLFNIAQAYRRAGQARDAYSYYAQFLARRPDAPNRTDVEGFMDLLRHKLDAADRAEAAASAPPSPASAKVSPPTPAASAPVSPAGVAATTSEPSTPTPPTPPTTGPTAETAPASGGVSPSGSAAPAPPAPVASAVATPPVGPAPANPTAAAPAATPAPAEAIAAPAPPAPNRTLRYAGLAAAGLGVGAEVLAYVFHASAQSSANELARRYQAGTLQASDASLRADAQSKGRLSTLTAVGGLLFLAAGSATIFAF